MSEEAKTEQAIGKKSGKGKKIIVALFGTIFLLGAGAGAGYYGAVSFGLTTDIVADPDQPKLVAKDGEEAPAVEQTAAKNPSAQAIDKSTLKATYYPIETPFTSNLKNSDSFAQISLAIATYYDERVLENIQAHETAIRSSVLLTLAEQDSSVLATQQGKEMLQGLLTTAINKVLSEKVGFGGIDNVYFTSFVVQ